MPLALLAVNLLSNIFPVCTVKHKYQIFVPLLLWGVVHQPNLRIFDSQNGWYSFARSTMVCTGCSGRKLCRGGQI
ncbi:hypothetical protein FGO68_gene1379 [Halteria grandinella]|uniref:Secreted protein n=1 Tax=Halteria grandinella TaxID=5974 RepID=A0A8J8NE95_HALGN|nr:hypothetical protein FGO68_gene1379 [Halteria grandinella]